ncbi:circadian clock-controlled protein daywake [Frankliniella occidentalis]|uniref:Circadian clock-controlled protein daywake n=1 Tax=Frankliniella occidentalis TaxID=133901 RepID=A0A6J1TS02_FRAOC|nr:circadian clock-controlled protein daywake [Frankliniella occidentalis]
MKSAVLVAVLALVASATAAATKGGVRLPEYFPTACARNAPDLNECIRKNMQFVMPLFAKGEKLFDMEPIEPIAVSDVRVQLRREPFDFHAVARNSKVYGASSVVVRAASAQLTDSSLDMALDIHIPTMFIEGDFKIEGKIGSFPFAGRGPWNVTITDLEANWHLMGETVDKEGEKYMQIKRFIPTYRVGGMKANAENLVEGAPELTNLAMNLINQYWEPVLTAMMPATRNELERHLKRMASSVFDSVPYKQLFPVA